MKNPEEYIKSGILEMYVLGLTSDEESIAITKLSSTYPEIKKEIEYIENSMMLYAEQKAGTINPTVGPMIMGTIDYIERLKAGEIPTYPPVLNERSTVTEYASWLNRPDMVLPAGFNDIYVKIIGNDTKAVSAIVWIKDSTPYEIHEQEFEKFLIVEGTCDIITSQSTISLKEGDYYNIPLHIGHEIKVTSKKPCKVILQRVAA